MTNYLNDIKTLLDQKAAQYNCLDFIDTDPIQIPHRFSLKEDIEIAGFFTATIAWGQRKSIINNANRLMQLMDNAPYDFVCNAQENDLASLEQFVHRTFNGRDCRFFIQSLRNIYLNHNGMESVFTKGFQDEGNIFGALKHFREVFLSTPHEQRIRKHLSDVAANSSAKRLNMFLRWMVRQDEAGVDFGLWRDIPMSALMLPLDVHTGDVARAYGLLARKQNDWKAVEEITAILRQFDPHDPIRYDFALFGIGAFDNQGIG
ncbi:TIGR02757 family protein [Paludibacter jiangxiensis]|uniref:TIGR02757 family protein n=1 Tax=Paludibacter jiangxiensis TaxID=681398 RepID=A0A161LG03_9BACT|nr:TIGR02757 family protein [Paludibacter jiangxiensis]GAT64215.1 TIGR02757 family protein [Paludibacter jiangxiensis]